ENLEKWVDFNGATCRIKKVKNLYKFEKGYDDHPVVYVSWYGAKAYSRWAGKQLPSEQEWEKAARGKDGAIYPWGDTFEPERCNSEESKIGGTSAVKQFPKCQSPYGCFDMAGNVWEWTDSYYEEEDDSLPVLRGGSWYYNRINMRCANRDRYLPNNRNVNIGLRCSRTSI
ncbi:MAG: formylglycine-generating enzyme family protein, partial [bacterium]|nr:formylglycine-generating enzyme family protein [bacterium]